jgi:hypothetical protein
VAAAIATVATVVPSSALAAERFAAPGGTGASPCVVSDPCALQNAVETVAVDGDTVTLLPGDYDLGSNELTNDGEDIVLRGQPGAPRPRILTSAGVGLFVLNATSVVRRLEISHSGNQYALWMIGGTVEQAVVTSSGDSACFLSGATTLLRDSVCVNQGPAPPRGAVGFESTGTESHTLRNVTAIATGAGYAIDVLSSSSGNIQVDARNVIAQGGAGDVRARDFDNTATVSVSLDFSNFDTPPTLTGTGASASSVGSGSNQTPAPSFVNAGAGDYHQASGSPTIDAGTAATQLGSVDFEGDLRARDGDVNCSVIADIGADEFVPPAPSATFTSGPPNGSATSDSTPSFGLGSDSPPACTSFECKLDAGSFGACTSPHTTATLADGGHTLQVRATHDGQTGVPTSRSFRVDTAPPQTAITDGPSGPTNDSTPTFRFASNEGGSTFQCRIDSGSFAACASPRMTAELADGDHTFRVRARDRATNLDPSPASRAFAVDTTAPETEITSGPRKKTRKKRVTFEFGAGEPGSSFECALDGESFSPCDSPTTVRAKKKGKHSFEVRATDEVGNADQTPAEQTWKRKKKRRR